MRPGYIRGSNLWIVKEVGHNGRLSPIPIVKRFAYYGNRLYSTAYSVRLHNEANVATR